MQPERIVALAVALAALGCVMLAGLALARLAAALRGARTLASALDRRSTASAAAPSPAALGVPGAAQRADGLDAGSSNGGVRPTARGLPGAGAGAARASARTVPERLAGLRERIGHAGVRWLDTPLGRRVVAVEDRRLLDQCGFVHANARGLFLVSRIVSAFATPAIVGWLAGADIIGNRFLFFALNFTVGFMLPKLLLERRAAGRRRAVVGEIPVFVDLLRLLQGVGLSLDQSLQVTINDFGSMLPVLSGELALAQRQFAAGRTRAQSLQRLATSLDNDDLRAVVRLMIEVDRHGGAVQEPLKQFGERLRETRRAVLRERIGRLTVKMTGVMILTLLPALLIITAGPGMLSVTRALSAAHH
ncbi:MAG TPA: type II secretion system F family protein [Trinickia sp.]|jgi:tight adherence protein C|nr:type II secretion system F family protein [Trinickia sp.]